jgi:putative NADH-flavin reductase
MKITIIAATGGIGRHLLQQALAAGHDVSVVARTPGKLPAGLPVEIFACDLADPDPVQLERAVAGSDAVLSGLGPVAKAPPGVATIGTRAVVDAMEATATKRIVVVSAAPIGTVPSPDRPNPPRYDPGDGFLMRHVLGPAVKAALRSHYADLAAMEGVLRSSDLDWTVARPPRLTDGPRTSTYRTALDQNIRGGWSISRADVAHQMLQAVVQPETVRQTVGMSSQPGRQRR